MSLSAENKGFFQEQKRTLFYGALAVLSLTPLTMMYGTHVDHNGEEWRVDVKSDEEGYKLRFLKRYKGGRPFICAEEPSRRYTFFSQKEYSVILFGEKRLYQERAVEYRIEAPRYNECLPIEW